jgi:hypothetical protein
MITSARVTAAAAAAAVEATMITFMAMTMQIMAATMTKTKTPPLMALWPMWWLAHVVVRLVGGAHITPDSPLLRPAHNGHNGHIAAYRIKPVRLGDALLGLHWTKITFETGFEQEIAWRVCLRYGATTKRSSFCFMR